MLVLSAAQRCSNPNDNQEEPLLDAAVQPELGITRAKGAMDVTICHESRNSSDMPAYLTGTLAKSDKRAHSRMKRTFDSGSKLNSLSSNNSAFVSPSHAASSNVSDEAIDLTGYASRLTSPATKRKRQITNFTVTSQEVRQLNVPDNADVSVNDVDNCSGSTSSTPHIKTEVPTAADLHTDWSLAVNASIPAEGNSLNEQSYYWKGSGSLDTPNTSVKEDASANASEQVL